MHCTKRELNPLEDTIDWHICDMKAKPVKTVSLRIDGSTFCETQKILTHIRRSRNRYVNEAIEHYANFIREKFGK
jgi:hypothetical protein